MTRGSIHSWLGVTAAVAWLLARFRRRCREPHRARAKRRRAGTPSRNTASIVITRWTGRAALPSTPCRSTRWPAMRRTGSPRCASCAQASCRHRAPRCGPTTTPFTGSYVSSRRASMPRRLRRSPDACRCAASTSANTPTRLRDLIGPRAGRGGAAAERQAQGRLRHRRRAPAGVAVISSTSTSRRRATWRCRPWAIRRPSRSSLHTGRAPTWSSPCRPKASRVRARSSFTRTACRSARAAASASCTTSRRPASTRSPWAILRPGRQIPRMEFSNTVVALLDGMEFYRTDVGGERDQKSIDQTQEKAVDAINARLRDIRFRAPAGQHRIAVAFFKRASIERGSASRRTHPRAARSARLSCPRCRCAAR